MENRPILSLCIPTWNRASFLKEGLSRLEIQLNYINQEDIEIFISDNCSSDNTPVIVESFVNRGVPITYNRNKENIGMDGNFITCTKLSHGQFIWIMGDDDYLIQGILPNIINTLKCHPSIGLMHLCEEQKKSGYILMNKLNCYLKELSYWSTFITGNIFNRDVLNSIQNLEEYKGSYLTMTPLYLFAAMSHSSNIIYYDKVFEGGADAGNNGGYNYFQVFVQNYLNIWLEYTQLFKLPKSIYTYIKKDIFIKLHLPYIHMLLIQRKNILTDNQPRNGRKGFYIENSWKILRKYYGKEGYTIPYFILWEVKNGLKAIIHKVF